MDFKNENIYTDLGEFPIYNFYKCFDGEYRFIYKEKKGEDSNIVTKTWNKLYNEYCVLTLSNSVLKYYRLVGEIDYLNNRKIFAPVLLNLLLKTPITNIEHIIKELRLWKIKINTNKELAPQIQKALVNINNGNNKINRKQQELESIKNKPTKTLSLQEQKAKLHKSLGVNVDLHNSSVLEWLAYWEELKNMKDA